MGVSTNIQWCDHTWNPYRGCAKPPANEDGTGIAPECFHCYAEKNAKRNPAIFGTWGKEGSRVIGTDAYWRLPYRWNADAKRDGVQRKVFIASLADIFEEREDLLGHRYRVFKTIMDTPALIHLLLTKRPGNVIPSLRRYLGFLERFAERKETEEQWISEWLAGNPPANVWLGTSCGHPDSLWRVRQLGEIPAVVRFVSAEPMTATVDFSKHIDRLSWVICGGESGPHSRPFDLAWARSLRDQCREAGVPYFLKQCGSSPFDSEAALSVPGAQIKMSYEQAIEPENLDLLRQTLDAMRVHFRDKKGGAMDEWPEDLRIRQFPDSKILETAK